MEGVARLPLTAMLKRVLPYRADPPRGAAGGFEFGVASLVLVLTLPVCSIVWLLAIPYLVAIVATILVALVWTRGRSILGWTSVGILTGYVLLVCLW